MKNFFILFSFFYIAFLNNAYSLEKGKWIFVKEDEYCYIGSIPEETDLPVEKKRGDTYILVYQMKGNKDAIIQVEAGYNYNKDNEILLKIDNTNYQFYSTQDVPDSAWTDEDAKVILAMKKGLKLVVIGKSSRGTVTNDTYTLKGFTAAFNKLGENC